LKTADLDPSKNYVFGYHPHGTVTKKKIEAFIHIQGIISFGAVVNFGTDSTGFDELFPGISMHLLTLTPNFRMPFLREILMKLGAHF
jgi:2-acylglycerol O-acyltransferase 2